MAATQTTLVYNPSSGRGKGAARAEQFQAAYRERFRTDLRLRPTRSREDIRVAARETADRGGVQIIMGGDGTISESLQALFESTGFAPLERPVGLLPAGSGNSFLRDFGINTFDAACAGLLQALEQGAATRADIGLLRYGCLEPHRPEVDVQRVVFNFWSVGLTTEITAQAVRMRFLGAMNYTVAAVQRIAQHRPLVLRTTIDGNSRDVECNFVSLSNSRFTGGAMQIAPPVRINDGKLFMVMPHVGRLELFRLLPKIFSGRHLDHPRVESQFLTRFEIQSGPILFNVDGELERGANPRLEVRPSHWQVLLPPEMLL